MTVETNPSLIGDLNASWPLDTDPRFEGAAHLREIKSVLQKQFPQADAALSGKFSALNVLMGKFDASGNFTAAPTLPSLNVSGAVSTFRQIYFCRDGSYRFSIGLDKTGTGEGDQYVLSRFDTSGNYVDNPLVVNRGSGEATFLHTTHVPDTTAYTTDAALNARTAEGRYALKSSAVTGTPSSGNLPVTNLQLVAAPTGDTANAYVSAQTTWGTAWLPTFGWVSDKLNGKQPVGDYALNNMLAQDVSNLQGQINGKQPSGNYVGTPSATSGSSGDLKINQAAYSNAVGSPYLGGYNSSGSMVSYILAQTSDLNMDRSKRTLVFQTAIQSGQRVTFNPPFSQNPDGITFGMTQRVDLWYQDLTKDGVTIFSNVSNSQTITVNVTGNK